jgi:hypothetical protein
MEQLIIDRQKNTKKKQYSSKELSGPFLLSRDENLNFRDMKDREHTSALAPPPPMLLSPLSAIKSWLAFCILTSRLQPSESEAHRRLRIREKCLDLNCNNHELASIPNASNQALGFVTGNTCMQALQSNRAGEVTFKRC